MEGADPHRVDHTPDQRTNTSLHLLRSLVGEGDSENRLGRDTEVPDQVGDSVGEHPGLARACPGHDKDGTLGRGYCLPLGGVQVGKERRLGWNIINEPLGLHWS